MMKALFGIVIVMLIYGIATGSISGSDYIAIGILLAIIAIEKIIMEASKIKKEA